MLPAPSHDQAIAANFLAAYTWFQQQNPACTVRAAGNMVCAHASGSLTDFNVALPAADRPLPRPDSESFRQDCAAVRAFFTPLRAPFSCWTPGGPTAPEAADLGFSSRTAYTGLYLDLRAANPAPHADLTVRRVRDEADIAAFADLIALGWSMPPEPYRDFFQQQAPLLLPCASPKQFYLGLADNRPVCCMELFVQPESGVAGIYYVATHPEQRRKGYAAAMQSQVLELAAQRGLNAAVVVAEPGERRLLGRLGFVESSAWYEYVQI